MYDSELIKLFRIIPSFAPIPSGIGVYKDDDIYIEDASTETEKHFYAVPSIKYGIKVGKFIHLIVFYETDTMPKGPKDETYRKAFIIPECPWFFEEKFGFKKSFNEVKGGYIPVIHFLVINRKEFPEAPDNVIPDFWIAASFSERKRKIAHEFLHFASYVNNWDPKLSELMHTINSEKYQYLEMDELLDHIRRNVELFGGNREFTITNENQLLFSAESVEKAIILFKPNIYNNPEYLRAVMGRYHVDSRLIKIMTKKYLPIRPSMSLVEKYIEYIGIRNGEDISNFSEAEFKIKSSTKFSIKFWVDEWASPHEFFPDFVTTEWIILLTKRYYAQRMIYIFLERLGIGDTSKATFFNFLDDPKNLRSALSTWKDLGLNLSQQSYTTKLFEEHDNLAFIRSTAEVLE